MASPRRFDFKAGEYVQQERQRDQERIGKVVRFLRQNPLSTSSEVFRATGVPVIAATKWCINIVYEGKRVWRLNHRKLRAEGME